MSTSLKPGPSWLRRAEAWLRDLNHQRLARRKLRKQRAVERAWLAADDAGRPEVVGALQQRLAAGGREVNLTLLLWPTASEASAYERLLRAPAASLHGNWELLCPHDQATATGDPRLVALDARAAAGPGWLDAALGRARGSHVVVVPRDWILAPHALALVAEAIHRFPRARLIYGDDDCIDARGRRHGPCMRCDWNQELLRSSPYIDGLVTVPRERLRGLSWSRIGSERAAWWSMLLQLTEGLAEDEVLHVPHVLGHRLGGPAATRSIARPDDDDVAAVQAHLDRRAPGALALRGAEGGLRVQYPLGDPPPLISLIVPTRNGLQLLRQCVRSIVDKTDYPRYEIVVVDNGSDDPATLQYLQAMPQDPRIRVLRDERPFNFSALNNAAARHCRGELLALVNNDVEVIGSGWLREMACLAVRPDVGAVGARLWFADGTLQHAGVVLGIGGVAGHVHRRLPRTHPGYHGRAKLTQEFSAVTAACLVLRKEVFDAVGGLDEANLAVDYNDIDFCLRIRRAGYRIIWTPHAELYHHESATRGQQRPTAQQQRYDREVAFMRTSWTPWLHNDPAYNPNLTLRGTNFELTDRPRVNLIEPWYRLPRPAAPLSGEGATPVDRAG